MAATTTTAIFLLALLLISEASAVKGSGLEEGKKVCKYKSKKFWGVCFSDTKCSDTCRSEGFQTGDCQGVRRRCLCQNICR